MCEVNQIFPITVFKASKRSANLSLVDGTLVDNLAVLVEVLDDDTVGRVEVESSDGDGNLSPVHGLDVAGPHAVVDLDGFIHTEPCTLCRSKHNSIHDPKTTLPCNADKCGNNCTITDLQIPNLFY